MMLGLVASYDNASVSDAPHIVLVQAYQSQESAVSLDPDRPWRRYIDDLAKGRQFQPHHISEVRRVYDRIKKALGDRLPLPVTQPTHEGALQLAWDTGNEYVDVDVFSDGTLHWYYRNRTTNEVDGTDDDRVRGMPPDLIQRLVLLLK